MNKISLNSNSLYDELCGLSSDYAPFVKRFPTFGRNLHRQLVADRTGGWLFSLDYYTGELLILAVFLMGFQYYNRTEHKPNRKEKLV